MDIVVDSLKVTTVGKPPSSILTRYRQLEGRKTFTKDETLTFENTGSNIELWQTWFPGSKIIDEGSLAVFEEQDRPKDRPTFKLKRDHLWWQAEAFEKFKNVGPGTKNPYPCFAFLYDPGGGKSKSLTDAMTYLYCENKIDAAIIVAPNDLVAQQWPMSQLPRDVPDDLPATYWKWDKTKKGTPPTRHMSADIMDQTEAKYDGDKFKGNYLPNGNRVSETKIFYGIDVTNGNWAVLPLSGGRFGEAKDWVEKLERIKNPVTGKKAAYFIQVWEVYSKDKTSLGGDDYKTWGTRFKCWVNEYEGGMDAFEQAKELAEALAKNEVKTDYESFSAESAPEKTDSDAAF